MKSRAEINRENYLRSVDLRREKARERMREVRERWRADICRLENAWTWQELPAWEYLAASGLSEFAFRAARGEMEYCDEE